jgi:hypothetical protein
MVKFICFKTTFIYFGDHTIPFKAIFLEFRPIFIHLRIELTNYWAIIEF